MKIGDNLSHLVELLPPLEERAGVRISAVSAYARWDSQGADEISVAGEVTPRKGHKLDGDIRILVAVYDHAGRVIGTASETVDAATFRDFETFAARWIKLPSNAEPSKVRVYPQWA